MVKPSDMEPEIPDQRPVEGHPASGVNGLAAVAEALAKNGAPAGYRVVYRTNPRGEHVVAVIWPPHRA
jgi:hypothetical protein